MHSRTLILDLYLRENSFKFPLSVLNAFITTGLFVSCGLKQMEVEQMEGLPKPVKRGNGHDGLQVICGPSCNPQVVLRPKKCSASFSMGHGAKYPIRPPNRRSLGLHASDGQGEVSEDREGAGV